MSSSTRSPWTGAGTALVTPMDASGAVDFAAFRAHVAAQVSAGIRMLIVGGTTGEGATLSADEKSQLLKEAAELAAGRAVVVAGLSCSAGADSLGEARAARAAGADAVLAAVPAYVKPPQDALVDYFVGLADDPAGLPVVLYNVPGRTAGGLELETILELARHERIVAIKDAKNDLDHTIDLAARCQALDFEVLSGDDASTLAMMALGVTGVVSVVGNQDPVGLVGCVESALRGDFESARAEHERLLRLMRFNFVESNPIPVKAMVAAMGYGVNVLRSPLRPLAPQYYAELEELLRAHPAPTSETIQ